MGVMAIYYPKEIENFGSRESYVYNELLLESNVILRLIVLKKEMPSPPEPPVIAEAPLLPHLSTSRLPQHHTLSIHLKIT